MTERAAKTAPRLSLSGAEWKLWLAAALGAVYTLSWLAMEGPAAAKVASRPEARGPRVAQARPAEARAPRPVRVRTRSS